MENITKEFEKYEPKEAGVTGIFCDTNVNWNQPQWLLESPPDEPLKYEREDRLSGEDDCDNSEPTWTRRDLLAWYVPAHTGRDDYGIHFDASAVRTLGNTLKSLAVTSSIPDREWLIAAIEVCFWHEVCHAWVEDLVSLSESITGGRYYQNTQKKYGNYIYMEEALCNTSVTGMLKAFFQSNDQKQMIFNAVGEFMKKQPAGYRNYIDLKWWSANQSIFLRNLLLLLERIYRVPNDVAIHALRFFFDITEVTFPGSYSCYDRAQIIELRHRRKLCHKQYMERCAYPVFLH